MSVDKRFVCFVLLLVALVGVAGLKISSLKQELAAIQTESSNQEAVFRDLSARLLKGSVEIKDNGETFIVVQGSTRTYYDTRGHKFEVVHFWSR